MVAKLLALVLPLGLDTFAVAAGLAASGIGRRERRRVTWLFTLFETAMPLAGLAVGAPVRGAVGAAADYVAIAVLFVFGLYTLLSSEAREAAGYEAARRADGLRAVGLAIGVSIDELAIGFSLGLLGLPVPLVIVLIAIQACTVSQLGLRVGARLSERLREGSESVAGAVLTALALVLVFAKLA